VAPTASVHDSKVMEDLLQGGEEAIYGDKADADQTRKAELEGRGAKWCVSLKAARGHRLSEKDEEHNRRINRDSLVLWVVQRFPRYLVPCGEKSKLPPSSSKI